MNKIPSTQQLSALKTELEALLKQHGFTAAYLVGEYPANDQGGNGCVISSVQVKGKYPSELLMAMCEATGKMLLGAGIPAAPKVSDN